jgi:MFS family permease
VRSLLFYAALLTVRMGMRFCALVLVRRLGYKYTMIVGVAVSALQSVSLIRAEYWQWLALWIATVSLAESLYWPIYHSASAVVGHKSFGRELGIRAAATSVVNVIGPALGGFVLATYGAPSEFSLAALMTMLSILPLLGLKRILAGAVPEVRQAIQPSNNRGIIVFAAGGWMPSGISIGRPMILFLSLGSRYEALGLANAGAGLVGALAGLYSGAVIDRGGRNRSATWVLRGPGDRDRAAECRGLVAACSCGCQPYRSSRDGPVRSDFDERHVRGGKKIGRCLFLSFCGGSRLGPPRCGRVPCGGRHCQHRLRCILDCDTIRDGSSSSLPLPKDCAFAVHPLRR